jgi:hypothetical protein
MPAPRLTVALVLLLLGQAAAADVFRPAYLELRQTSAEEFTVTWRIPSPAAGVRLDASVRFPDGTQTVGQRRGVYAGGFWQEQYRVRRQRGLEGSRIEIDGLLGSVTDVIARVERLDGSVQVQRLLPDHASFIVRGPEALPAVSVSYLMLGIGHILGGIDHLLFVLALLLVVRGARRIFWTLTAFTLAHSITLIAATLGWVAVPAAPVEAVIALSIVFVAAEAVRDGRSVDTTAPITVRSPWIVAFGFGLLHGLGFAGAIAELGLPEDAVLLALLMFNVGVEIGQIVFVGAVLSVALLIDRLAGGFHPAARATACYVIGSVAALWTLERIGSFW